MNNWPQSDGGTTNHTDDDNFKQQVDLDFNLICDICSKLQDGLPEISCETVSGIKTLKNNKAYDGTGISAEHLKYACILNKAVQFAF